VQIGPNTNINKKKNNDERSFGYDKMLLHQSWWACGWPRALKMSSSAMIMVDRSTS